PDAAQSRLYDRGGPRADSRGARGISLRRARDRPSAIAKSVQPGISEISRGAALYRFGARDARRIGFLRWRADSGNQRAADRGATHGDADSQPGWIRDHGGDQSGAMRLRGERKAPGRLWAAPR